MIADTLVSVTSALLSKWQLGLTIFLLFVAACTYTLTACLSSWARRDTKDGREPPTVPYFVPFLGGFFAFATDTKGFIDRASRRFGHSIPYSVKIGPFKAHVVQQPEYLSLILNAGRSLTNKPYLAPAMCQLFGTPKHIISFYGDDNSGVGPTPLPGTSRPAHQRVWAHHHHSAAVYLSGDSLHYLGDRFISVLSDALGAVSPTDPIDSGDWVELPDFYSWWRKLIFRASVDAMFGPHLLRIYPGLEEDFWIYHAGIPKLLKYYPKWLYPAPYAARDRILDGLTRWHVFARDHSDPQAVSPDGKERPDDEYWGSSWIKYRYRWGQNTKVLDERALAAEDLTMLTAANANAVPMAFWYLMHVYSDANLLDRVQGELRPAIINMGHARESGDPLRFDLDKILTSPLLQSIFAEVLRLYASFLLTRMADGPNPQDIRLGPWKIDRRGILALSTASAARSQEAWGDERTDYGRQPLEKFWAERFLTSPSERVGAKGDKGNARFSLDKLAGAWIPFAAGTLMCPGRHLAKQELIGSAAVFAAYFELEVLSELPPMDDYYYGMGTQPPAEPCRVRIRRKVGSWKA